MLVIARGLMAAPRLLLLDEPSLGLAPSTAQMSFETIVEVRRRGITICLVEQDVHSTLEIADYAYVLEDGAIVADGVGERNVGVGTGEGKLSRAVNCVDGCLPGKLSRSASRIVHRMVAT